MSPSINQQCIGGINPRPIIYAALQILLRFKDLLDPSLRPEKTGGFLALMTKYKTIRKVYFPVIIKIGNYQDDLPIQARQYAQEKCQRLYQMVEQKTGHISSHQSRNPEHKQYGGGVLGEGKELVIGAFSGISELRNEALIVVLFLTLDWIGPERAAKIKNISQNPFIDPLILACADIIEEGPKV